MSDLFDLPFEEEPPEAAQPAANAERRPPPAERSTRDVEPRTVNVEPRTANAEQRTANVEPRTTNVEPRTTNVPVPARRVFSVTELTVRVRDLLEAEFFEVWVEGELSNC